MKSLKYLGGAGVTCALAFTLVGCAGQAEKPATDSGAKAPAVEQKESKDAKDAKVSLANWKGTWNDFGSYLDMPEVQEAIDEVAKKEGTTSDEAKAAMKKTRNCEFHGLVIEGDTISFLDGFKDKDGKETSRATYKFVEAKKVKHGGKELEWDVFKAVEKDAKYPLLMMMPVHGEEELTHFHMRYGTSVDEMMAKDDWYPTFIAPTSTIDQVKDEVKE
ncbi:ZinT/AdcA family metal-binding protein [Berryella wangjianweii]|uniref:ZinT/AdcA family metal-binding protein n=1 Tax=Berryella wangjianweii TaxID=2734634 RepID=A0A6M8J6T5_9ACTN|nr:ZinT/AdcA family metal-binding protein [Berryella wangjianweii]QKF07099.1 ZinT/AdcA family metal-binding protein [Berryella wangjianweii]